VAPSPMGGATAAGLIFRKQAGILALGFSLLPAWRPKLESSTMCESEAEDEGHRLCQLRALGA
jgi:hypothetical protein